MSDTRRRILRNAIPTGNCDLASRPRATRAREHEAPEGLQHLGIANGRDGLLYVPNHYRSDSPTALVVLLHGAGGNAQHGIAPLLPLADAHNLILLAPESRGVTWDLIEHGAYGPDVAFIDLALEYVFERCAVIPDGVVVAGFSDGASYALSLGLANGGLFGHVIAFSPGFMSPPTRRGTPRLFVAHGTEDRVLSIDACSRRLVPKLQEAGYDVRYREFAGPHAVPLEIARESLQWLEGGVPAVAAATANPYRRKSGAGSGSGATGTSGKGRGKGSRGDRT